MGTLCAGLLPLVRGPELKRYQRDALKVLDRLQPIVARKIELFLTDRAAGGEGRRADEFDEDYSLRRPGLTLYLVLKTYNVVKTLWRPRAVLPKGTWPKESRQAVAARRMQLEGWVTRTLQRARETILDELQESA